MLFNAALLLTSQLTDHGKPLGLAQASRAWYGLSLAQECLSLATAKRFQTWSLKRA